MRPPAPRWLITAAVAVSAAALLAISPYALLVMLPALLLTWVVLLGWFTGDRAIAFAAALTRRLRVPRRRQAVRGAPRRRARHWLGGSGLLLAHSLASRPPPARGEVFTI